MKKTKGILILLSLVVLAMFGCRRNESNDGEIKVTEITIWHYYNGAQKTAFDNIIREFNESVGIEKNISVTAVSKNSIGELAEQIIDSADKKVGSDQLPNMFATYIDTAKEMDSKDLLVNLDNYFTEEELDRYVEEYIEEGRFDEEGRLKVFPTAKATEIFMMNKTDWDKFAKDTGVTVANLSTWEGLVEVSKQYYEWSDGKAFFGRDALANYLLVGSVQLGQEIFSLDENGNGTAVFDKTVMRKLWDNYYVPYISGYFLSEGRYSSDDLKTGSIIAYVGSTSSASYFPQKVYIGDEVGYDIECMVLPVPNFDNTESVAVQQGAGYGVIKSTGAQEEACAEFLKWFTESERNTKFSALASYLPVTNESNNYEYIKSVAEAEEMEIGEIVLNSLITSVEQIGDSKLYTTKAIDNGYSARYALEDILEKYAMNDRAAIQKLIEGGMSSSEAIAQYDTDQHFEEWYKEMSDTVNGIIQQ